MEFFGCQFDVIVIGAGVMGSSTAYQTAKRGKKTLLLEQFDFLHCLGSSHGESRTIRSTYPEEYYSAMVIQSSKLWEEAESEIGFKVYYKTHQLDMGPADDNSLLAVIANCQNNSSTMPHRVLDNRQIREEYAGKIELPDDWIAVSTELGGVLKPTKAVSMFQTLAIKHGAVLRDNTEVVNVTVNEEGGGIFVHTISGDRFWGKKCVVTVGAWMKKLVEKVKGGGLILPIQPIETSVSYWKIKAGHEADFTIDSGGFPTFASYGEPYIYGTPALEFPGLIKIAVHGGRQLIDPGKRTWTMAGEIVVDSLREWVKGRFGDRVDSTAPVMTQSCLYSMTPDEDFVIDFLGGEFGEDVVIAGGFSGHGFKMAPLVGRLLADLALVGEAKGGGGGGGVLDIRHFRIERFERNPKGNVKDFDHQVSVRLVDDRAIVTSAPLHHFN